jgi:Putative amidoligase enzyme
MSQISQHFGLKGHPCDSMHEFVAGMECEIESIHNPSDTYTGFTTTTDGSLRNHGYEFISAPLVKDELLACFKNLHATLQYHDKSDAFTNRTSTHVHVNCRTLTPEQTKQIVMFYALFEEFFFAFVDPVRRSNIHCVPLTETFLPATYHRNLNVMIDNWHKYTALNILPLVKLGTIEFRHLQGTDDAELTKQWLSCLERLWTLAQKDSVSAAALIDEAHLKRWWLYIFEDCPKVLALENSFHNIIKNNLMDVKLSLI